MRIFGFSFMTLLLIFIAFYLGSKNPGALAKIGL
jgi:hypothetical protein